jgi:hypothetical protein
VEEHSSATAERTKPFSGAKGAPPTAVLRCAARRRKGQEGRRFFSASPRCGSGRERAEKERAGALTEAFTPSRAKQRARELDLCAGRERGTCSPSCATLVARIAAAGGAPAGDVGLPAAAATRGRERVTGDGSEWGLGFPSDRYGVGFDPAKDDAQPSD